MRALRRLAIFVTTVGIFTAAIIIQSCQSKVSPPSSDSSGSTQPVARKERGRTSVHFIDVGQGDSILIISTSGKVALIDGGNPDSGALQYIQKQKIDHVDVVIGTHPHADHIGGLVDVLEALSVGKVWDPGAIHDTSIFESFQDVIIKKKVPYGTVKAGEAIPFGDTEFEVLNAQEEADKLDNTSVVCRLRQGGVGFLFTGDAQKESEDLLVQGSSRKLSAFILKVGHHGSRTSSSPEFLAAVSPKEAIYCAGVDNKYGLPNEEPIDNLKSVGAKIYGTDTNGTVIATTDGETYEVHTEKAGHIRAGKAGPALVPDFAKERAMEIAVIDSFEDGLALLLVGKKNLQLNVPRGDLPKDAKEGDWLQVELESGRLLKAMVDVQMTEQKRKRMLEKRAMLLRGEHLR